MPSEAVALAAVAGSAGTIAAVDLWTRRLPDPLTMGVAALGFMLAATGHSGITIGEALGGFALGLLLMLPGHVIGATGAGDVKIFAAMGTMLGPSRIGMAFLYTAIAGGVLALVIASRRGRVTETIDRTAALIRTRGGNVNEIEQAPDNRFAYAPAIAAGVLAAALGF